LAAIQALVADLPTYGYRRVHALLRRQAEREGRPVPNVKRVYRVMKLHGLLLQRHAGGAETRRHEGKVAVAARSTRWCSDGLEIAAENGERVRVAFALDCCDREAMSFVATTAGISGEDVRDLMVAAVEHRFGRVNRLPGTIEWLTDNGGCYLARETRRFARDVGLVPKTTPLESPQSNGMAEASCERSSATTCASLPSRTPRACCASCRSGWRTTTSFTRIARWATARPASSSPDQPRRPRPVFKGQQ
jgi:putative transposase